MNETNPKNILRIAMLSTWGMITLILVCVVGMLMFKMRQYEENVPQVDVATISPSSSSESETITDEPKKTVEVNLFFAASSETKLVPKIQRLALTQNTVDNCRIALDALIAGPSNKGLSPILSSQTRIRAMYLLENNELVIDFSRDIETGHIQSASSDMLLVQGIYKTLSQSALKGKNDRGVSSVRFLFEGSPYQGTFPAHYDLSDSVNLAMESSAGGIVDAE